MNESSSRSADSDPRFSSPVREGELLAGKYVVGRLLGLGGMGAVFEAREERLERRVAVKVLLPRLLNSPTAASRFKREAKAATRITSEHVVKVVEIGDLPDGTPFLVMEYLEGKDLRAVLRECGPLSPHVAIDYLLQALQAVAEGHMNAVIHRDLKPSNLFLSERADGTPLIKVLDFGIAKTLQLDNAEDLALTSSEDVQLGSPTYMPPEQFTNPKDVDATADIWSLGVTLYELIGGKPPFQGASHAELVGRVLASTPEPLRALAPGSVLPAGLDRIVLRCLEKKREQRYKNAVELATALAPYGSDDARLSLTRVSGLSRSRTPVPLSSQQDARDVSGAFDPTVPEPTLPMGVDPLLRPHSYTSSGARRAPTPKRGARLWIALAALLAVVLLIWSSSRSRGDQRATTLSAAAPPRLVPELSQAVPGASTSHAVSEPLPAAPAPSPMPKLALPSADGRRSNFRARPGMPGTAPTSPTKPSPAVASDEAIEKLIENRH